MTQPRKCECGRSIPIRYYSTIQSKQCPHCIYLEAIGKKKSKPKKTSTGKKERKKHTPWREKPTDKMIIHLQKNIVNPYIRERDNTCFHGKSISDNGRISDAGHFYSVGSKKGMRFNPQNIHGQSKSGNSHMFKGGDLLNYRRGLVHRFGEDYVKELEYQAMLSEGSKNLDRLNVLMIGETYLHLHKNKIWVFTLKEFEQYKIKLYEDSKHKSPANIPVQRV
jgi:hypothetical protein